MWAGMTLMILFWHSKALDIKTYNREAIKSVNVIISQPEIGTQ